MGAIPCCIICPNPYKPVSQGNVGLVTKFGRFSRAVDPGLVKINPLSERLIQVDVKLQIVEVPRQVCMTKDNVTLNLTSVIYYHITSPHKAAFGISNIRQALIERTQTTLRHVVGARVLQDVIERREEIAQSIGEIIRTSLSVVRRSHNQSARSSKMWQAAGVSRSRACSSRTSSLATIYRIRSPWRPRLSV